MATYYYHNWYLSKLRRKIKIKGPYANVKLEIQSGKFNRQLPDISKVRLPFFWYRSRPIFGRQNSKSADFEINFDKNLSEKLYFLNRKFWCKINFLLKIKKSLLYIFHKKSTDWDPMCFGPWTGFSACDFKSWAGEVFQKFQLWTKRSMGTWLNQLAMSQYTASNWSDKFSDKWAGCGPVTEILILYAK